MKKYHEIHKTPDGTLTALAEKKESWYQRKIMSWIKLTYPLAAVWKNAAGVYSQGGIPDISAVIAGHYFGIEVKRPGGRATELQKKMIDKINKAGGTAGVCTTIEDANKLIGGFFCESN